jgi:hypothetical protein
MLKMVRELGLLAVGVAVAGLVIAWLLAGGNVLGNWLLAAFLFGHGWIHVMYVTPPPPARQPATAAVTIGGGRAAPGPEWAFPGLDHSWLLDALHSPRAATVLLGRVLVVVSVVSYSLAALAAIPLVVSAGLWAPLVLVATLASAVLMLLYFHRNLIIGLAIDAVLLWVVIVNLWTPGR